MAKAVEHDQQEMARENAEKIQKSSWLQVLDQERREKIVHDKVERQGRAARLAHLFEEEDVNSGADDEDMLDGAAADQNTAGFLDKIDAHLQMEKKILEAWHEKDKEGGPKK